MVPNSERRQWGYASTSFKYILSTNTMQVVVQQVFY
jgi:hypothetical protein